MALIRSPLVAIAIALVAVACNSDGTDDSSEVTSTGTASVSVSVSPSPIRTPSVTATAPAAPTSPYRVTFAPGETIDVSPAVVFADLDSIEAESWVVPEAGGEFVVSPAGGFVIYSTPDGFKLLRTEDGAVNSLGIGAMPIELGPGDSGFIAVDQERFLLTAYDSSGHLLHNLWRSAPGMPAVASWAEDGSIAVAQNLNDDEVAVSVFAAPALEPQPAGEEFRITVPGGSQVSLEWSPGSDRVAVVTADAVYALDRNGTLLWMVPGEFLGNPRWSPDGEHLSVFAKPRVVARDGSDAGRVFATYVLGRDAREVLRFPAGALCEGNPWLDAASFVAFGYRVGLDGTVVRYEGPSEERWERPEELGFQVDATVGYHFAHIAARDASYRLDDGRWVFTTANVGHGGCGEGSPPLEWPAAEVEYPPYGPVRAAAE